MVTAAELEAIISGPGTKADRGRKLIELGCDRTDLVDLLGMTYGQAHGLWKEKYGTGTPRRAYAVRGTGVEADSTSAPRRLNLRPAQTRFITQDGHVVLKWNQDGTKCANCEQPITFTLQYLGFVHSGSKSEPTKLEDHYD